MTQLPCLSGNAIPGSRQRRDIDLGETFSNIVDTWWFILILIIIGLLVIGLILLAIWKALGLSCTKVKLMMMMA